MMPTRSSPRANRLDTPNTPAIRFTRALDFGAYEFTIATACQFARLPLSDQTRIAPSAPEAFTSRLSVGSVSLSAAGYDYDIDWTPMSAGLAPAGMAASFAALAHQAARRDRHMVWVARGQCRARRQRNQLIAPRGEEPVGGDKERVDPPLDKARERRV